MHEYLYMNIIKMISDVLWAIIQRYTAAFAGLNSSSVFKYIMGQSTDIVFITVCNVRAQKLLINRAYGIVTS